MTRPLLAVALAVAACGAFAPPASADCVSEYRYDVAHNPYKPLPSGGGGGEPGGGPMPGHPREWADWTARATVVFAKCLAGG